MDLKQIYQDTIRECLDGEFNGPVESKLYRKEVKLDLSQALYYDTKLSVVNNDCLVVGKQMIDEGLNPAVLNMASAWRPGGGVLNGARAQEECIFRRTNLFMSLYRYDRQMYNLVIKPFKGTFSEDIYDLSFTEQGYPFDENFGGIYSAGVTVFKDSNYEWLDELYETAFISVAAMNINRAVREGKKVLIDGRLSEKVVAVTKNKIRTIYRIGILNGHNSLVLGAWGCGAFGNPPEQMAQLFLNVLNEPEFNGKYKDIRFAIIEDHNSRGRNFQTFKEVVRKTNF